MAQPDDIEARMAAQEARVDDLSKQVRYSREDAAAARLLAGGADRDVADVREQMRDFRKATTSSLNALREDMNDGFAKVDRKFERVDRRFDRIDRNFDQIDRNFVEVRGKFDAAAAGHQQIVDILNTIIERDK